MIYFGCAYNRVRILPRFDSSKSLPTINPETSSGFIIGSPKQDRWRTYVVLVRGVYPLFVNHNFAH